LYLDFEIWSLVESVTTINTLGEVFKRSVTEFDIAYRKVVPQHKGEYFLNVFNEIFNIICTGVILINNKVGMFVGYASTTHTKTF
jgi:hypothetical protein